MPLLAIRTVWDFFDQSIWAGIGLVVALLAMAWLIHLFRAWYGDDADRTDGSEELLMHLRELQREGEVSEEEYRSIKGRLTERMER